MARLSGLPSEHHQEGPGDAPRRKRGRPGRNQAPSEDVAAVAPVKRTASPSAELSHTKRTKRVQVDDDEDQIAEEMQQSFSRSQRGDTIHIESQKSITTTTRRHNRRHSEPLADAQRDDNSEDALENALVVAQVPSTQPEPGLTPHLDRIGIAAGASRRFNNTRRARMSMPAQLQLAPVDETDGTRFQYAPLTEVLDGRTRRRLRRSHLSQEANEFEGHLKKDKKVLLELRRQLREQDETIKDLEYRLEARRLGDIDMSSEETTEVEARLLQARNHIDELRASSVYNGEDLDAAGLSDDDDNDDLLLVNPDELHLPHDMGVEHTSDGKYASRVLELSSQVTFEALPNISQLSHDTLTQHENIVPDKIHDQAVERYERELQHYITQLAESQGALRVISIELQNLHFIEAGAPTADILTDLRHGFDSLRLDVEKYFPDTTTGLTNQQLLHKVPELFGGIFFELKEKITLLSTSQKSEVLLRRQYEGVLDLLGESAERVQELEQDVYTLDKSNEAKQRTVLDLDERVAALTTLAAEQKARLRENESQIHGLQDENGDKETSIGRLREAIEQYRRDLETVTATSTKFEVEHHEMIARMEEEQAVIVQGLEADLAAEQESRLAAEADAEQKSEYIDELEARIARMESDVDDITIEMTTLRENLATQTEGRIVAQGERDVQIDLIYQHANTIENLNETLIELKEQIEELRNNLLAERSQREKTEGALDEGNDKIADLTERLHDSGLQANELRSKLFQVQQEKEAAIARLQDEAQEREDVLNEQLVTEAQLLESAEATIASLEQTILKLQTDLETAEDNLVIMTTARQELELARDIQVASLAAQLTDLKVKYTALETSTNSTITSLQANITDLTNQVQRQQVEIKRLNEELAEKDRVYEEDTTLLREQIEVLEADLNDQKSENTSYRKENASLSKRVEEEANELLNIMGSHSEQVDSLKIVIATHEATIANLQAASAQRTTEYEDAIEERTREITEMQLMGDARAETIVLLEAQIEELKKHFRTAEEDTRVTIDALTLSQRQLQDQNDRLAADLKKRNADALQAVQDMKLRRVEIKTQGADLHRVLNGKIIKTSEKVKVTKKGSKKKSTKRQWDSGFGVDENVEEGDEVNGEDSVVA